MKYRIHQRTGNAGQWQPTHMLWADAVRAAKVVERENAKQKELGTQIRFRVVPEADDDCAAREARRIAAGEGKLPKSWESVIPLVPDYHWPRLVRNGVIGYFSDERDAAIGKLNELSASRYLNTFIHHVIQDPLTLAEEAGELVERPKVLFTDVSEECTKIYLNAGRDGSPCASCATRPTEYYRSNPVHPSAIYGKPGDVAMLYTLADGVRSINAPDARVTARCIICPAKKLYVGLYGYPQDVGHIRQWLNKNGYAIDCGGAWNGVRLNYVTVDDKIVTAQCDFGGYFRVKLENGEPVVRIATPVNEKYVYEAPAGAYLCYSQTGIAGLIRKWKE